MPLNMEDNISLLLADEKKQNEISFEAYNNHLEGKDLVHERGDHGSPSNSGKSVENRQMKSEI